MTKTYTPWLLLAIALGLAADAGGVVHEFSDARALVIAGDEEVLVGKLPRAFDRSD